MMLTSLALIFLVGLAMAAMVQQLKLPRIIGMLITGIVVGPYVLDWLDLPFCPSPRTCGRWPSSSSCSKRGCPSTCPT